MIMHKVWTVYRKEIRDTLRDKRTVMVMILVPILLYPLLFTTMGQIMTVGTKKLEMQTSRIALQGSLPPDLVGRIEADKKLSIAESEDALNDLQGKVIQGFLKQQLRDDTLQYVIVFDAAIDKSRKCRDRIREVLLGGGIVAALIGLATLGEMDVPIFCVRHGVELY